MITLLRRAWLLLVLAPALVLAGCGTVGGAKSDADKLKPPTDPGSALDRSAPFLIEHGKLIGTIVAFLVIVAIGKWLWGNIGMRIVGVALLTGWLVYYVVTH